MRIDVSQIPQDKQNDPRFLEEVKSLRDELSVPGAIKAACIHEVGHLIYFRLLGESLNIPPNLFCFVGPSVTFEPNKNTANPFDHFIAATGTPFGADDLDYTDKTLLNLAKACFAGGVFAQVLTTGSLRGDDDDRRRFHRYYDKAIKQRGQMDVLESQLRLKAIEAVTGDLKNAALKEQALIEANQLETVFF